MNMEVSRVTILTIFACFSILISSEAMLRENPLQVGFYNKACPQAEQIVADTVARGFMIDQHKAAGLIRLFFHDCFVNGCDASILLDSTPSGEHVEKEAAANDATLRGLEVIDEIKAQLEVECPDTVSCADILAFAAREAVALSGLSHYPVPGGRRDGLSSLAADVPANIPGPSSPIDAIAKIFLTKGLTIEEMVVLTGAHSIGSSHCKFFDYRLYNFNSTHKTDPSLDRFYAQYLSSFCPPQGSWLAEMMGPQAVNFDRVSPTRLDNEFYIKLLRGMALLQSDQAMASDPRTSKIVRAMAVQSVAWSKKFAKAMIRLGWVDVLSGNQGEIRKNCRAVN